MALPVSVADFHVIVYPRLAVNVLLDRFDFRREFQLSERGVHYEIEI